MERRIRSLVAGLVLVAAGCGAPSPSAGSGGSSLSPAAASQVASPALSTAASPAASPSPLRTGKDGRPFAVEALGTFDEPWAMTFLPDGNQLITQRGGTLLLRDAASGKTPTVTGTPDVLHAGQGGLGDVVLSPTFETDRMVYLSWAERGDGDTSGAAVGRATLVTDGSQARLDGLAVIWRQTPKVSGTGHYGHRLAFSPDGAYLFVTSGERQKFDPAQDLGVNLGKILRLTRDGKPAPGNPFADRGGVGAQIWSYGHRNPLGIAFDASGNLWESEMGPKGGDEVNLILPGANYGWPKASNGSHYSGEDIPDHKAGDGFEAPKVWWNPSISPGSLMIYSGTLFAPWQGDAFVGALSGQALIRVDLDSTSGRKADQWDLGARIREVEQGPDGAIYLLEDGPRGRLLRLTPLP